MVHQLKKAKKAEEDNIAPIHKTLLRPPLQDFLLKLKDKYSKDR